MNLSGVDHSLDVLEFGRVTAAIAERAACAGAAVRLAARMPLADATERARELAALAEAIRRAAEPGAWCEVGRGSLASRLDADAEPGADQALDGPGLVEVRSWLEAADATREAWRPAELAARYPDLHGRASSLPELAALRARLTVALEPDGRVSDAASPALKRARADVDRGERDLQGRLEKWAKGFGSDAYVTRHGDRFVALVPAAGFPRRRAVVHDASGSGQSLFVEPLEATEANNHLIESRAIVRAEEHRVLVELAGMVLDAADELRAIEDGLVGLDVVRAASRWARELGGRAIVPGGDRLRLVQARHPLLAMGPRAEQVVPLDLELGPEGRLVLVSGPNMGGKTVLLKTVGLAVALAHAGLPVLAAEESAVPEIDRVLADVGDAQSLDQGLSTFAAHLRSLAAMAEAASPRALLLADEIGGGTDPEEGAALGRALLERFAARGAWGVLTTHFGGLKRAAGEIAGVQSGSLEFDRATLTPRFRFQPSIPGASHALAIAERLGLDAEIVARARAITPEETRAVERLLETLGEARRAMEARAAELTAARAEAERSSAQAKAAADEARRQMEDLRRQLTRESEVLLARVRELWQTVEREARRADKSRERSAEVKTTIGDVEREVESLGRAAQAAAGVPAARAGAALAREAAVAGARVFVRDLGVEAEVVGPPDAEGRLVVRRGALNIQTHLDRLEPARTPADSPAPARGGSGASWDVDDAAAVEVDVRGMDVDAALRSVDEGLDRSVLSGLQELRIVHGVGRGILRTAIERHLQGHPQVAERRLGRIGEGGRGVTVVGLR